MLREFHRESLISREKKDEQRRQERRPDRRAAQQTTCVCARPEWDEEE